MSDVKYYALKRGEDFPSEFCAVDDSDGEPGVYRYYVPEGFWDNGGTLHMELPKLPDAIMVRLPDERDREVYSSRSWRYVREDESENAKLRELVRAAYNCTNAGPSCLECRIVAGGCTLLSAMRELGVDA